VQDVALATLGPRLYEMFVAGYVSKQWGRQPAELNANVFTSRFSIRYEHIGGYLSKRFEGLPAHGYGAMFAAMLDSHLIDLVTGTDVLTLTPKATARHFHVYTGPIDAFFGWRYGALQRHVISVDWALAPSRDLPHKPVVTHPSTDVAHYRTHRPDLLPWNAARSHRRVLIGREHAGPGKYEISFVLRTPHNTALMARYQQLARTVPGYLFAGRGAGPDTHLDMSATATAAITCAAAIARQASVTTRKSA
jgi:UDP-galactopyranose mutase